MSPDLFRKLAALDLSHEQMAGVLEIMQHEAEERRAKARSRVQKWRNKKHNVTSQNVTEHNSNERNVTSGLARGDDNSSTIETTGSVSHETLRPSSEQPRARKSAARDVDEFRTELAQHLDTERIEALVKHRRTKKGQITGHAARLFLRDAADCGLSPVAAADACISRNWITVKPEYFGGRKPAGTGPPPDKPRRASAIAAEQIRALQTHERDHDNVLDLAPNRRPAIGGQP